MCRTLVTALLAVQAALAAPLHAQTTVTETEPNGTKPEANSVICMRAGDSITGTTTGSSRAAGDASDASVDMFRIATCALPAGTYRHRLWLSTSGVDDYTLSVRGLNVYNPSTPTIDPASDVPLQYAPLTVNQRFVEWYGFGRSEQVFVRISGSSATVLPYVLTLSTEPMSGTVLQTALASGQITITTVGQGHNTDTEIHVYDANRTAIPGFANDDALGTGTQQSTLTRTYTAGIYWLAIGRFNIADNLLSGFDDAYGIGPVLDFPDVLLSSSASGGADVSFAITDSNGTQSIPASVSTEPFDVQWFRMTVIDPVPPIVTACAGDGTGSACPCGNFGGNGNGCGNSVNSQGGRLAAAGLPSVALDSLVLIGSGMPVSSALYFQGTSILNSGHGIPFGDGVRCVGGSILRLGTKTNFGGVSQFPSGSDPHVSVRGLLPAAGGVRFYQIWYRNSDPTYCTGAYYNLTDALGVTWIA